jgi:hypothetical protein
MACRLECCIIALRPTDCSILAWTRGLISSLLLHGAHADKLRCLHEKIRRGNSGGEWLVNIFKDWTLKESEGRLGVRRRALERRSGNTTDCQWVKRPSAQLAQGTCLHHLYRTRVNKRSTQIRYQPELCSRQLSNISHYVMTVRRESKKRHLISIVYIFDTWIRSPFHFSFH